MRPISDRVVIEPAAAEETTKGGLIIPDTAKEKPLFGVVAFTGPSVSQIKVGDKVLYSKFTGQEISYTDKNYLIAREDDVLAIID